MTEPNQNPAATVPEQPEAKTPLRKSTPVVIALVASVALIGIANVSSLLSGNKKSVPASTLPMRPATANPQQVNSLSTQQQMQAQRDAEERQRQQELAAALQQLQAAQSVFDPESATTPPMTAAQRDAIYGSSPNAPQRTSNVSQAQAEAKQKALAREKQHQDALNSDTVAIDFAHPNTATGPVVPGEREEAHGATEVAGGTSPKAATAAMPQPKPDAKSDPMAGYDFDHYQGQLYRVFEGTVLEGVVTNHIDGGLRRPILVMLTTDYYSHDHQQLLMPQGTRLIVTVPRVAHAQPRKTFANVT